MARLSLNKNHDTLPKGYSLLRALLSLTDRSHYSCPERDLSDQQVRDSHMQPLTSNSIVVPTAAVAVAAMRATRDLTAGTASAGGYLVGTDTDTSFVELLVERSTARRAGVQMLPDLVGNVVMPRMTAGSTAYWLSSEGTPATESMPTFGSLSMTPKTVGAYVECSRQLLFQTSAETIVANDMLRQIAAAVDRAVFQGTGANGQPTGLINLPLTNTFTGTGLNYAAILDAMGDVIGGNVEVDVGDCCFVTTPAVAGLLKNRFRVTGTDTPIWAGSLREGQIEGHKAFSSVNMPAATALFGDFSTVLLGQWGPALTIDMNPYQQFPAGIVGFRVFYSCDVAVRSGLMFSIATGIT